MGIIWHELVYFLKPIYIVYLYYIKYTLTHIMICECMWYISNCVACYICIQCKFYEF